MVTGFDFAEGGGVEARRLAAREGATVTFEQRDVFGLGSDFPRFRRGVGVHLLLRHRSRAARGYAQVLHDILSRAECCSPASIP
jgi:hypothetical protein